jgi:hypothetical protein
MKLETFLSALIAKGLLIGLVSVGGCVTSQIKSDKPALSLVEPMTRQFSLDDIPQAQYTVKVKNEKGEEEIGRAHV